MPVQAHDWTCSACALAWVLRSTGLDNSATEESVTYMIGVPQNINSTYGLMDGSGVALQNILEDTYDQSAEQRWPTFDQTYAIAGQTTGCLGGSGWYHWCALRGVSGDNLWIANSAPGWEDIWDTMSRQQFNALGPFSLVSLV